jgi:hypothetical protein
MKILSSRIIDHSLTLPEGVGEGILLSASTLTRPKLDS